MRFIATSLILLAVSENSLVKTTSRRCSQKCQNEAISSYTELEGCNEHTGFTLANALKQWYFVPRSKNRGGMMVSKAKRHISASTRSVSSSLLSSLSDDEILSMDAVNLSKTIQMDRTVTCEQLMKATLSRIDMINPTLNAIILLRDKQVLLDEARNCDRVLKEVLDANDATEAIDKNGAIGWLFGIPVAIKDVSNSKGIPTTMGGSPLFCQTPEDLSRATFSDPYVENMISDGAIVIGKTNTPEGGLGSNTFNDLWGKTLNPFATDATTCNISAGGSSGGAAVAVATKMLALADGTDNMGSLRNPAGWNNIYSLRPTAGIIPSSQRKNSNPTLASILPHPASTPGPMARTPQDCARLLQSMVGNIEKFNAESLWRKGKTLEDGQDTIRILWLGDWKGRIPMEAGILSTCQKALEDWSVASSMPNSGSSRILLEEVVADGESPDLFDFDKLWEGYNAIRFASTLETYSQQFDVDSLLSLMETGSGRPMKEELAWELEQGKLVDKKALDKARDIYEEYEQWLREIFLDADESNSSEDERFHFLALPSAQVWPFPIEDRYPRAINGTKMDTYHRWMEVCVPVSFGGLPCVTIPAGFGRNGNTLHESTALPPLPIGIQLFGRKGDDGKLLNIANSYFHHRSKMDASK